MPSYKYELDERERAGSRFISRVNEELRRALATEKAEHGLTQQAIAEKLGVNRSVINRKFMGLENLTARSIGELLWAIGWEPFFEAQKVAQNDGGNEFVKPPTIIMASSTTSDVDDEPRKVVVAQ
jgi:hypothetical protein